MWPLGIFRYTLVSTVCTDWIGRDPVTNELQQNLTLWPGGMRAFADVQ